MNSLTPPSTWALNAQDMSRILAAKPGEQSQSLENPVDPVLIAAGVLGGIVIPLLVYGVYKAYKYIEKQQVIALARFICEQSFQPQSEVDIGPFTIKFYGPDKHYALGVKDCREKNPRFIQYHPEDFSDWQHNTPPTSFAEVQAHMACFLIEESDPVFLNTLFDDTSPYPTAWREVAVLSTNRNAIVSALHNNNLRIFDSYLAYTTFATKFCTFYYNDTSTPSLSLSLTKLFTLNTSDSNPDQNQWRIATILAMDFNTLYVLLQTKEAKLTLLHFVDTLMQSFEKNKVTYDKEENPQLSIMAPSLRTSSSPTLNILIGQVTDGLLEDGVRHISFKNSDFVFTLRRTLPPNNQNTCWISTHLSTQKETIETKKNHLHMTVAVAKVLSADGTESTENIPQDQKGRTDKERNFQALIRIEGIHQAFIRDNVMVPQGCTIPPYQYWLYQHPEHIQTLEALFNNPDLRTQYQTICETERRRYSPYAKLVQTKSPTGSAPLLLDSSPVVEDQDTHHELTKYNIYTELHHHIDTTHQVLTQIKRDRKNFQEIIQDPSTKKLNNLFGSKHPEAHAFQIALILHLSRSSNFFSIYSDITDTASQCRFYELAYELQLTMTTAKIVEKIPKYIETKFFVCKQNDGNITLEYKNENKPTGLIITLPKLSSHSTTDTEDKHTLEDKMSPKDVTPLDTIQKNIRDDTSLIKTIFYNALQHLTPQHLNILFSSSHKDAHAFKIAVVLKHATQLDKVYDQLTDPKNQATFLELARELKFSMVEAAIKKNEDVPYIEMEWFILRQNKQGIQLTYKKDGKKTDLVISLSEEVTDKKGVVIDGSEDFNETTEDITTIQDIQQTLCDEKHLFSKLDAFIRANMGSKEDQNTVSLMTQVLHLYHTTRMQHDNGSSEGPDAFMVKSVIFLKENKILLQSFAQTLINDFGSDDLTNFNTLFSGIQHFIMQPTGFDTEVSPLQNLFDHIHANIIMTLSIIENCICPQLEEKNTE